MPSEVLLDPCRTWCPSSSCQAVCQVKEAESPALPQLVRCSVCTLEFCSACKANWHPGQACQESNLPITSFLPGENRLEGLKFKRVKSVDPGGNGSFKPGADERLDRTCFSAISSYCGMTLVPHGFNERRSQSCSVWLTETSRKKRKVKLKRKEKKHRI